MNTTKRPRHGAAENRGQPRKTPLTETDGPTLRHAIQGLHGQRIILPRRREQHPSVELLATRYERFLELATAP